ncbi:MAG TPA: hypothetical protein VHY82_12580 [Acetobacteraceae bacterium]|nr:hypothetical protein [Acetobacteraceae bacterium]
MALLLCVFNVVFEPSPAVAAGDTSDVPARTDNIYGGLNHQPTQNEVQERERAAGVSLSAGQNRQNTVTLDDLYQKLEGQAGY